MRIANVVLHSCARAYKLGWMLLARGHTVHLVTERIQHSHPWKDFSAVHAIHTGYSHFVKFDKDQLRKTIETIDPIIDLYHVNNEPDWIVSLVREVTQKPIIWDIHDMVSQRTGTVGEEEAMALNDCDGIAVPSRRYHEIMVGRTEKPCAEILNGVPAGLYPTNKVKPYQGGIVYEGGLRSDTDKISEQFPFRNWVSFFKELTQKHNIPVWAYTNHSGGDLRDYGMAGVQIMGPLSYQELLPNLTAHEVGLVGSPFPDPAFDGAMPNKLFEYIAAGLPVIVINAPTAAEFVMAMGYGEVVKSVDEIPAALEKIRTENVSDNEKPETLHEFMWNYGRWQWTLEGQMDKLEKLYQDAAERYIKTFPPDD